MAEKVEGTNVLEQNQLEAVRALVATEMQVFRTSMQEAVKGIVETLTAERTKLEKVTEGDDKKEKETVRVKMYDPRQHLYDQMRQRDPIMAQYRSPDIDHWNSEFLRSVAEVKFDIQRALHRRARAEDELKKLGWERHPDDVKRALAEGTTTTGIYGGSGGPLIPVPLESALVLAQSRKAKFRNLPGVPKFNSVAGALRVPGSGAATCGMVLEGATFSEATPTPTMVVLSKKKMQGHMYASRELIEDSAFDIGSFFVERVSQVMAETEDVQISASSGAGANFTNGLATGSVITEVPEASSGVLTFIDLVNLWFALPEQYQEGAMWFINSTVAGFLSRLTMPNVNWPVLNTQQPLGTVGDGVNIIGTIFGRPVVILPFTGITGPIFVGNPANYGILENPGMTIEADIAPRWGTDETAWKFTRRIDGNVLLADAFRKTVGITSIA